MAKSIIIAYILWLFGGWFGLHHFYLRRDKQAFVWWCTCGGCFGLGWLRDLCRIPEYVADANNDPDFLEDLTYKMKKYSSPPFSYLRFSGELLMGWTFGYLLKYALPTEFLEDYKITSEFIGYFGVAVGVHMVANIGREVGSFKWALIGSQLLILPYIYNSSSLEEGQDYVSHSAVVSAVMLNWQGKSWRRQPDTSGLCKRIGKMTLWGTIYLLLWGSMLYYNSTITTKDGETVKLRDAIHNFFKSPMWSETKATINQLYEYYQLHGFWKIWDEIKSALDPEGEANAYKVLGLSSSASQEEIKSNYKKLARQWHPDKIKDPEKKIEASKKFMEIQQAYEVLSSIKNRRAQKSKSSHKKDKRDF